MENSDDVCDRDESAPGSSSPARNSQYWLFGRQSMVHQCMGGRLDVLLLVIIILFLKANFAVYRNRHYQNCQSRSYPDMVTNAAVSFRVKINSLLLIAHDITLGKDFRLFFKVVVCLWLLSVVGSYFSFFTLAYIGAILSITVPSLYSQYEEPVDICFGLLHRKFSQHYKIVDENFISKLPMSLSKIRKHVTPELFFSVVFTIWRQIRLHRVLLRNMSQQTEDLR